MLVSKIEEYDKVMKMATDFASDNFQQRKQVTDLIARSDSEELVNILEVSRGIAFDNTGDDDLYQAVSSMINFIQMSMAVRMFKY